MNKKDYHEFWGSTAGFGGRICPPLRDKILISAFNASISWACNWTRVHKRSNSSIFCFDGPENSSD